MSKYTYAEVSHIAVEINQFDAAESGFLQTLFVAWQRADGGNKFLLYPVVEKIIDKYELAKYLNYDMGLDRGKRMVEDCLKSKCPLCGHVAASDEEMKEHLEKYHGEKVECPQKK
nr:hypothetical protein [uncultured Nitrososphaera sp.]